MGEKGGRFYAPNRSSRSRDTQHGSGAEVKGGGSQSVMLPLREDDEEANAGRQPAPRRG